MSWSKLGVSWSKLEQGERAGVSWEQAGAREASWSELGASWSKGSKLELAGSEQE